MLRGLFTFHEAATGRNNARPNSISLRVRAMSRGERKKLAFARRSHLIRPVF